jgi:hypothetical protein
VLGDSFIVKGAGKGPGHGETVVRSNTGEVTPRACRCDEIPVPDELESVLPPPREGRSPAAFFLDDSRHEMLDKLSPAHRKAGIGTFVGPPGSRWGFGIVSPPVTQSIELSVSSRP